MGLGCDICGSNSFTHLGKLGQKEYFRCRACGSEVSLIRAFPEPEPELDDSSPHSQPTDSTTDRQEV